MKKEKNNTKGFFYYFGNCLMIISVAGFFYILYPVIGAYFFPPTINHNLSRHGSFITIPRIHAQAPIITSVDPWNEVAYHLALQRGVAQAKGTALPGQE